VGKGRSPGAVERDLGKRLLFQYRSMAVHTPKCGGYRTVRKSSRLGAQSSRFAIESFSIPAEVVPMPKFVIEREIPGAGNLTAEQLQAISQKSCGVLHDLGPSIQWIHSYVTDDKVYCIYIAPDEALVRKHAALGGFPANKVSEVKVVVDPTTAEVQTPA
jgi:Protein of unknown function (DUF4242)